MESRGLRGRRPYVVAPLCGRRPMLSAPYVGGAGAHSCATEETVFRGSGVTRRVAGRIAAAPCERAASGGWNRSFLERRERREARREESASRGRYNHHGAAIGREERKARVREAAFPQTILCTNFCVGRCVCVCLGSGMVKVRSPARSTACERCELHERCVA